MTNLEYAEVALAEWQGCVDFADKMDADGYPAIAHYARSNGNDAKTRYDRFMKIANEERTNG